jgi:branched-chain amino acid transport system substrate-binding protein
MEPPIRIGVIAEAQTIVGASIPQAAQLAADEINAAGGAVGRSVEIVAYDNRSSVPESVSAFQNAVNENRVHAVIASHVSEIALALASWASRLRTPFVTPGAASNGISLGVHRDYEKNRYTFQGYLTSAALAQSVAEAAKALFVNTWRTNTAVLMCEDAAWTEPLARGFEECLPKIGLTLLDAIRFQVSTANFVPVFERIKAASPGVIITGMTKAGIQPIIQWGQQRVPIPMLGMNSQASNSSFLRDTDGAADGVLYQAIAGPGVAVTPKSIPFAESFRKRFGNYPSYAGYSSFDAVYYLTDAIRRTGPAGPEGVVRALEGTDWEGAIGRIQFYGREEQFTHSLKYGEGLITGLTLQWQRGEQVCVWPKPVANAPLKFPGFIRWPPR